MVIRAIKDAIAAQGWAATQFYQYMFEDGVRRPAIFTIDPAPENSGEPLLIITQEGGEDSEEFSTRGTLSHNASVILRLWGSKDRSDRVLRELAYLIYNLFHNGEARYLVVNGSVVENLVVTVPQRLTDGKSFPGYMFTITATLAEERVEKP